MKAFKLNRKFSCKPLNDSPEMNRNKDKIIIKTGMRFQSLFNERKETKTNKWLTVRCSLEVWIDN